MRYLKARLVEQSWLFEKASITYERAPRVIHRLYYLLPPAGGSNAGMAVLASTALVVEDQLPHKARPPATVTGSVPAAGCRSRGPRRRRGLMSAAAMREEVRSRGRGRFSQGGEEQGLVGLGLAAGDRAHRWCLSSRSGAVGGQGQGQGHRWGWGMAARAEPPGRATGTAPLGPSRRVRAPMAALQGASRHRRATRAEPPWPETGEEGEGSRRRAEREREAPVNLTDDADWKRSETGKKENESVSFVTGNYLSQKC